MVMPSERLVKASGFILALVAGAGAMAAKPGGGGGGASGCTDAFPSFAYQTSDGSVRLASENGCDSQLLLSPNPDRRSWSIHFSADRSKGVLVSAEDPGNAARYVVKRFDFVVDAVGRTVTVGSPQQVLPLPGEEAPAGEQLFYRPRVWGNPDQTSLFLTTGRQHVASDGLETLSRQVLIYSLNDPTQFRVVFDGGSSADPNTWGVCPEGVPYPQFVAGCYEGPSAPSRLNGTGSHLYVFGQLGGNSGWQASMRLEITNRDPVTNQLLPLAEWSFGAPQLVLASTRSSLAPYAEASLWGARPRSVASDPEYAGVSYWDRTGKQGGRKGVFIDADWCVQEYASRQAGQPGTVAIPADLWKTHCIPAISFHHDYAAEWRGGWQSPDAVLQPVSSRGGTDVHRRNVRSGTSELLIRGGTLPDAGL